MVKIITLRKSSGQGEGRRRSGTGPCLLAGTQDKGKLEFAVDFSTTGALDFGQIRHIRKRIRGQQEPVKTDQHRATVTNDEDECQQQLLLQ